MKFGISFPLTEFGNDPAAIRDFAQMAEGLGFSHIAMADHVVGVNPDRPGGWSARYYTYQRPFPEPLVMLSFMAGVTQKIELCSSIVILPQRQTALVAKQVAALDVLSGGRVRLGVGLGWIEVEFIALNENFHNRGQRFEEQAAVMRQLWTQPLVSFSGRWHVIPDAGLNPMPVQRPIPLWFGGSAEAALRRIARLADGWIAYYDMPEQARPVLARMDQHLAEVGRSRPGFGIEMVIRYGDGKPDEWGRLVDEWQTAGVTHLAFNTMGKGFNTPAAHVAAMRAFSETLKLK
jgi:probable F420-dependent oxidoreductase